MDAGRVSALAAELAARAKAWEAAQTQDSAQTAARRPYLVGVAGVPGAGKSTLAMACAAALREELGVDALAVPMDGYHYSKAELDKFEDPEEAHFRRGAAFTFNGPKFLADLQALVQNPEKEHKFPAWSHEIGDPIEDGIVVDSKRDRIVIVEGNYLLLDTPEPWPEFRKIFDETWFIKVDIETAVQRTAVRNAAAFGWTLERTMARTRATDEVNMRQIVAANPEKIATLIIENPDREAAASTPDVKKAACD
ncbi:ATP-dependent kinase YFH7 [Hondaea fermentalgiana]|uniref:ATP-dependent kinase YFH7 n=1 Tax=Hondaea fermentalgiana TaxID=2315210 RepID=A0A2R5GJ01_9STRA|nr:ATP-dependent kinase YFH7 [Hondaea fermentalgiana]|eukprot:GBG30866.1 ATP-dependent kinase YFH7 [Hondaea fermentalgiana]